MADEIRITKHEDGSITMVNVTAINAFIHDAATKEAMRMLSHFGEDPLNLPKIEYFPIIDKDYWAIELIDILYGNTSLNYCNEKIKCKCIIDTGTSMLTAPTSIVTNFLSLFNNDCSSFQPITFVFSNYSNITYSLLPSEYISDCIPMLLPLDFDSNDNTFILGTIFLNKYSAIFNKDNLSVGFF